jgi:hypothetical protein
LEIKNGPKRSLSGSCFSGGNQSETFGAHGRRSELFVDMTGLVLLTMLALRNTLLEPTLLLRKPLLLLQALAIGTEPPIVWFEGHQASSCA